MDGDVGEGDQRRASLQRATFTHIFTHRHSLAHRHEKNFSRFFSLTVVNIYPHFHPQALTGKPTQKDFSLSLFYSLRH